METVKGPGRVVLAGVLLLTGLAAFVASVVTAHNWLRLLLIVLATAAWVGAYFAVEPLLSARFKVAIPAAGAVVAILLTALPIVVKPGTNGGSNKSTSGQSLAKSLVVRSTWPSLPDCDGATEVAMPQGGPDLTAIEFNAGSDFRAQVAAQGGASFGVGHLVIRLSARRGQVAQITGITPVVFAHDDRPVAWSIITDGGCGGSVMRLFDWQIDAPGQAALVDRGVYSDLGDSEPPRKMLKEAHVNSAPIGSSFTVSQKDTSVLVVDVGSCSPGTWEWGLRIEYLVDGHDFVEHLGSKEHPYRTVSGTAPVSYQPEFEDGRVNAAASRVAAPQSQSGCLDAASAPVDSGGDGGATDSAGAAVAWFPGTFPPSAEPGEAPLSGEGSVMLKELVWNEWSDSAASGTGEVAVNNCTPDCGHGHYDNFPIAIRLSDPEPFDCGMFFSNVSLHFEGAKPSWITSDDWTPDVIDADFINQMSC